MPARKPEREIIPHFVAVGLAPEGELKQQVIAHAERILAVRMRMLELALDTTAAAVAWANRYLRDLSKRPAPGPETPVRRDPSAVTVAQTNRAVALGIRLLHDMDRLRESAYREAREAAYRRTGTRVGPVFWSDAGDDLPPGATAPRAEPAWSETPPEPVTETAAETAALPVDMNPPAPEQPAEAAETGPKTLTKRLVKLGQARMANAGIHRRVQVELARRARQLRWTVEQFNAEIDAAIAARRSAAVPAA